MMNDGVIVARATVEFVPAPGLRTRIVETPGVSADNIVVHGVGDNRFSLGRLTW